MDFLVRSSSTITGASPVFFSQLLKPIRESIYLSNCFLKEKIPNAVLLFGFLSKIGVD